ncbi:hypothetical protein SAMN05216350_103101 [Polaromonas sp. YR568]|uniref:hypothetical protein n=1 Tax=Polaromonas sp. YR568 TaxID=1855301 RepID=UPI0008F18A85|nr:hypothetical protein [Polaromonas sp. YR568]SFU60793.1 hypothetical protein SAMN05216350_103101 [Polaromonas sp. YR568]
MEPHRVNIINTLQLIASAADQLDYQRQVPAVNVATELVNQWFDDFYHPGDARFEADFSSGELKALVEFNAFYDVRVSQLPDDLSEMLESPVWLEVMAAADKALGANNWYAVDAR